MANRREVLIATIRDWTERGLIPDTLKSTLTEDVERSTEAEGVRWVRYLLAATGAVVLLIAISVFLAWAWPNLEEGGRTVLFGSIGVALKLAGLQLELRGERWRPMSYLVQITGLAVLLGAFVYSKEAWEDTSTGGVVIGVLALGLPALLGAFSIRRNPVMPAAHLAFSYAFLAVFLGRATSLEEESIIWILDGVLLVSTCALIARLWLTKGELESRWTLSAFIASLYVGLVLIGFTVAGPLDMEEEVVYGFDLWLAVIVLLTLWGIHGVPSRLRRGWYRGQLALAVLMGMGLLFFTALESLGWSETPTALLVAGWGGLGVYYGLTHKTRSVLVAGCVVLIVAAWYYGVEMGGVLGSVLALAFTAGLLFWLSARVGRRREVHAGEAG